MGASLRLELLIRLSNLTTQIANIEPLKLTNFFNYTSQYENLNARAQNGTFGQIVIKFKNLHDQYITELLAEALNNASDFRNMLAHSFIVGRLGFAKSEEGIDIIVAECNLYRDHFERIENHMSNMNFINWELWNKSIDSGPEIIKKHPLYDLIAPDT